MSCVRIASNTEQRASKARRKEELQICAAGGAPPLSPSYPSVGPHVSERRVLTEAQSSERLHGPVYDSLRH